MKNVLKCLNLIIIFSICMIVFSNISFGIGIYDELILYIYVFLIAFIRMILVSGVIIFAIVRLSYLAIVNFISIAENAYFAALKENENSEQFIKNERYIKEIKKIERYIKKLPEVHEEYYDYEESIEAENYNKIHKDVKKVVIGNEKKRENIRNQGFLTVRKNNKPQDKYYEEFNEVVRFD